MPPVVQLEFLGRPTTSPGSQVEYPNGFKTYDRAKEGSLLGRLIAPQDQTGWQDNKTDVRDLLMGQQETSCDAMPLFVPPDRS
jgi:hypothetical protein